MLVGDGPDAAVLRATARRRCSSPEPYSDTAPWYRAADLVVLPSRWEGMAVAPLEAMACGRPVVLSDVDGARESLPPGREGACLVPPEDPPRAGGRRERSAARRVRCARPSAARATSTYSAPTTCGRPRGPSRSVYRDVAAVPRPERREPIPQ